MKIDEDKVMQAKIIASCNDCHVKIIFNDSKNPETLETTQVNDDPVKKFIKANFSCPVCHKGRLGLMKVLIKIIEL